MEREIRFIAKINLRTMINKFSDSGDPIVDELTTLLEEMECNDYYEAKALMGDVANSMAGLH